MKKLFSLMLALATAFSLCVPASAVGAGESAVGEVKVSVVEGGSSTPTVYFVTVNWESLTFTYTEADTLKDWKPETHNYETSTVGEGTWGKTTADITAINHSNTDIGVSVYFEGGGTSKTVNGVTAALTNAAFDLETGVGKTFDNADKNTATVNISGVPTAGEQFTVGMIKINIAGK